MNNAQVALIAAASQTIMGQDRNGRPVTIKLARYYKTWLDEQDQEGVHPIAPRIPRGNGSTQ